MSLSDPIMTRTIPTWPEPSRSKVKNLENASDWAPAVCTQCTSSHDREPACSNLDRSWFTWLQTTKNRPRATSLSAMLSTIFPCIANVHAGPIGPCNWNSRSSPATFFVRYSPNVRLTVISTPGVVRVLGDSSLHTVSERELEGISTTVPQLVPTTRQSMCAHDSEESEAMVGLSQRGRWKESPARLKKLFDVGQKSRAHRQRALGLCKTGFYLFKLGEISR